MFNTLVNLIFTLIAKIGDLILAPLISAITVLIPSFSDFIAYIIQFINYGFTYMTFFFKLLMIPKICIEIVVTIAFASLSIMTVVRTYTLIVKIYNYFKP